MALHRSFSVRQVPTPPALAATDWRQNRPRKANSPIVRRLMPLSHWFEPPKLRFGADRGCCDEPTTGSVRPAVSAKGREAKLDRALSGRDVIQLIATARVRRLRGISMQTKQQGRAFHAISDQARAYSAVRTDRDRKSPFSICAKSRSGGCGAGTSPAVRWQRGRLARDAERPLIVGGVVGDSHGFGT
jgi:hypothetical protein